MGASLFTFSISFSFCACVWTCICSGVVCVHVLSSPPRQRARRRLCASWMSAGEGSSSPNSTTTHREDWQPNRIISKFLQKSTERLLSHHYTCNKLGFLWNLDVLYGYVSYLSEQWIMSQKSWEVEVKCYQKCKSNTTLCKVSPEVMRLSVTSIDIVTSCSVGCF